MGEVLFETKGVGKTYGSNTVLHDIDMKIHSGEVIGLIGENGAGKSTLLRMMAGVLKEVTALLPVCIPVMVSFIALRKGIAFVRDILHSA